MDDIVTKITMVKDIKSPVNISDFDPPSPLISPLTSPLTSSLSSSLSSPSSGWDMLTFVKIFLIIVILALFGFNIFAYLAKGTDTFKTFMVSYGKYIPEGIKKTLNLTDKGTELGLDIAAGTINDVKDVIKSQTLKKTWEARDKKLAQSLDAGNFKGLNNFPQHEPDKTDSQVQSGGKKGWCYIGTDRTFRSCINVSESEKCMSGKIFPTKDICINPSLRQ